jgi:preprotein translocase subunit SecG
MSFILNTLLFLLSLFLILLVLVQRGRGGGLAGALGGMGGQSAFGTKAGDVFTRVTIVVAAIWILLCAAAVKFYRPSPEEAFSGVPSVSTPAMPQGPAAGGAVPPDAAPSGSAPASTESGASTPAASPAATNPATPAAP